LAHETLFGYWIFKAKVTYHTGMEEELLKNNSSSGRKHRLSARQGPKTTCWASCSEHPWEAGGESLLTNRA